MKIQQKLLNEYKNIVLYYLARLAVELDTTDPILRFLSSWGSWERGGIFEVDKSRIINRHLYSLRREYSVPMFAPIRTYLEEKNYLLNHLHQSVFRNPLLAKGLLEQFNDFFKSKNNELLQQITQKTIESLDLKLAELREAPGLHLAEYYDAVLRDLPELELFKKEVIENFMAFRVNKGKFNTYEKYLNDLRGLTLPMKSFLKLTKGNQPKEKEDLAQFSLYVDKIVTARNEQKIKHLMEFMGWLNENPSGKYEKLREQILRLSKEFTQIFVNFQKEYEVIPNWFKDKFSLFNQELIQEPAQIINIDYFFASKKILELKLIQHLFKLLDAIKQFQRDGNIVMFGVMFRLHMEDLVINKPIKKIKQTSEYIELIKSIEDKVCKISGKLSEEYKRIKDDEIEREKKNLPLTKEELQNKKMKKWKNDFVYGVFKSKLFDKPYEELAPVKPDAQSDNIIQL